MVLMPTALAVLSGTMTWPIAAPLLVAGAVGLAWPENTPLQAAAQSTATDVAGLMAAWQKKAN